MVIVGLPVLHTELKEHVKNVDFPIKLASLIQDLFVVAVVTSSTNASSEKKLCMTATINGKVQAEPAEPFLILKLILTEILSW